MNVKTEMQLIARGYKFRGTTFAGKAEATAAVYRQQGAKEVLMFRAGRGEVHIYTK